MGDLVGERFDALVLLRRAEHVLFAVLLLVGVVRAGAGGRYAPVVLGVVVGCWYAVGVVCAGRGFGRRVTVGWLLVLAVGWLALVVWSVDFVWVAFALFLLFLQLLPLRWALPAVVGLTAVAVVGAAAHRGRWDVAGFLGPVTGAAVATVVIVVYQGLCRESAARARLVVELTVAQDRLVVTQRRAGVLAERERLAREIHDTVGQNLSSVIMLLRDARDGSEGVSAQVRARLEMALAASREALAETRGLVRELTPAQLVGRSLPQALARVVRAQRARGGLVVRLTVDGQVYALPTAVAVALLRVTQEALANVRAHSGAGRVVVTLAYQPEQVSVDVVDDGCGFDARCPGGAVTAGTGLGLGGMRSRLTQVGGELVVESGPGLGTALSARVPTRGGLPVADVEDADGVEDVDGA